MEIIVCQATLCIVLGPKHPKNKKVPYVFGNNHMSSIVFGVR